MKSFVSITLLLVVALALVACGGDSDPTTPTATPFVILGTPDGGSPSPDPTSAPISPADESPLAVGPAGGLVSLDWLAGSAAFPPVP